MILIFGIDRYKVKLAGMLHKLNIMNSVINSGKRVPFYYVEKRDKLLEKASKLEKVIELYAGQKI